MHWIVVRTYGNGKFMNKVYPMWFEYLSQSERVCEELNVLDTDGNDKWIAIHIVKYLGRVW